MSQNPQSIVAKACTKDGKITGFFQSSPKDAPLPIHWMARAEPPKKRAKRGPGRPRIQRETEVIEIDPESNNESDCDGTGTGYTGDEELPSPPKTKRLYTMPQKKRVVAVARQESIVAAS